MNLVVLTLRFPDRKILACNRSSETASTGASRTLNVEHDLGSPPTGDPLFHQAYLVDEGVDFADADQFTATYVHETDPFEVSYDGREIQKAGSGTVPELADIQSNSSENYERHNVEGAVSLTIDGQTGDTGWAVNFYVSKSAYVKGRRRDHRRLRPEFVAYEMSRGCSNEIANVLDNQAESNGFTGNREKLEFVVDVVQRFPFVPDAVSRGYDDYTLYGVETLAEGGDCEDTSILLASVLQSGPFNYDTILIQPPGHMAVGIKGADDLPGYYWTKDGNKYYYIETTGTGYEIGYPPYEYSDSEAHVYQV